MNPIFVRDEEDSVIFSSSESEASEHEVNEGYMNRNLTIYSLRDFFVR